MPSRAHLWKRLVLLSSLASAAFCSTAFADEGLAPTTRPPIGKFTGGAGLYLSFSFGETLGVGYGVEAFGTFLLNREYACDSSPRSGIGPLVQFGAVNLGRPRLVLAAHGGGEPGSNRDGAWLDGELGATFRFGRHRGIGLHTGIAIGTPALAYGFGRAELFLSEYSVGLGARAFTPFGPPGSCAIGRPLRTESGFANPTRATFGRQLTEPFTCDDPDWVAEEWAHDAQMECASVPAFLQLAEELLLVNAPDHLVEQALVAAEEEIRHAHLCATIATRYGGRLISPSMPTDRGRPHLRRRAALVRLATESWVDGCLGEGAAALRARAAAQCGDQLVAAAHARIERDESSHAELGWRVLEWALAEGGAEVKDALHGVRNVVPLEEETASDRIAPRDAAEHGRLSHKVRHAILTRHALESRTRLDRLLG